MQKTGSWIDQKAAPNLELMAQPSWLEKQSLSWDRDSGLEMHRFSTHQIDMTLNRCIGMCFHVFWVTFLGKSMYISKLITFFLEIHGNLQFYDHVYIGKRMTQRNAPFWLFASSPHLCHLCHGWRAQPLWTSWWSGDWAAASSWGILTVGDKPTLIFMGYHGICHTNPMCGWSSENRGLTNGFAFTTPIRGNFMRENDEAALAVEGSAMAYLHLGFTAWFCRILWYSMDFPRLKVLTLSQRCGSYSPVI